VRSTTVAQQQTYIHMALKCRVFKVE